MTKFVDFSSRSSGEFGDKEVGKQYSIRRFGGFISNKLSSSTSSSSSFIDTQEAILPVLSIVLVFFHSIRREGVEVLAKSIYVC